MNLSLIHILDELRLISGFGDVKLARYGREFLLPVKSYCERKGLLSRIKQKTAKRERRQKTERSSGANKPADTAYNTFALYKAGKTITEIAVERGLTTSTIEGHLSFYIYTGALDVSALVSEEKKLKIQDAVESYGVEKLSPIKEVLGEDYSYGEIRAVIAWMRKVGMM